MKFIDLSRFSMANAYCRSVVKQKKNVVQVAQACPQHAENRRARSSKMLCGLIHFLHFVLAFVSSDLQTSSTSRKRRRQRHLLQLQIECACICNALRCLCIIKKRSINMTIFLHFELNYHCELTHTHTHTHTFITHCL